MPPPLGGDHLTSGLSTPTTRTPSVSGVIGRLLAPRRAHPNVGTRTGSICVRVVLRRGGPCGAPEPLGAPANPARARCARRARVGGARGAWPPPTPTRIPRRARGAHVQALTAPLHTPHGAQGGVPRLCPTHRHVRHKREAWAGRVRVGRVAHGYHPRPRGSRVAPSAPMCGTTSRSMRGARRGGPASTPQARTARARRARTRASGGARDARDGPRASARGST